MTPQPHHNPYRARARRDVVTAVCAALGVVAFTGLMIWVLAPGEEPSFPPPFPLTPPPADTSVPGTPTVAPTVTPGG